MHHSILKSNTIPETESNELSSSTTLKLLLTLLESTTLTHTFVSIKLIHKTTFAKPLKPTPLKQPENSIKMPIVPPCSEALTRRTTTISSSSSSAVRVRMSPGHHRSLCLNNESRSLRDDLFTVMPQNSHYEPLDKYSEGIREGIKVGLDIVFINLAQKFVSLTSPVEILSDLEEYVAQLSELDEMGYDCTKIWERFDTLRALSEQEQVARLKLEETTSTRRDKEVNATITHTRISELESELKKLKAVSKTREQETKL